ncbi:glycosyltransferase family 2 protein [Ramlibacter rhizophilus]|uniref:Glycosyltransferase family 2 protein n=1 Tax=Ramlibacter rhizophilus TaxID=1781167 RepID=A0A4Z0C2C1_9BURK|nr:glycosyltransferase family 2 protein [Ramlibacter rhizophilus]TFZ05092.1 glycosyltransferase family 2 protein [Ramlibacter rhizophilus]
MNRLSITIITRNEAANISECVRSCRFADEVVVVDCGSTDRTVELARAEGAQVHEMDWAGDGPQKNRAIDRASGDWFFSLDADERITPELAREIRAAIEQGEADGYRVPRLSMFAGRFIRHGGWRPDYTERLARRGRARYTDHLLHARLAIQGRTGTLRESIVHYSYPTLDSVVDKLGRYSSAGALDMRQRGRRGSFGRAVGHGAWAFIRTYLLRLGFLDGRWGFMLAVFNAETTYYRYLKLWLMDPAPHGAGNKSQNGKNEPSRKEKQA